MDRINNCDTLLKRNEIEPFLKIMITDEEKWITYDNPTRKRSWIKKEEKAQAIEKPELTRKKVMCGRTGRESFTMSCYRSIKQLIPNSIVNNCRDYKQLRRRPDGQNSSIGEVVFVYDNARLHISLMTRQKLRELGWEVQCIHIAAPEIASSDYHLFRFLQNSLNGVKLASKEACENHLKQFFEKPQKFYCDGIMALPQKWQNIIENNGAYLV